MSRKDIKVLVVDDEKIVRDFFVQFLAFNEVEAQAVSGGREAIELAKKKNFDLVFLDVRMPDLNGVEAMRELKKINPDAQYIMMTGYAVEDLLEQATQNGAVIHLKKPFDLEQIMSIINEARQG